MTIKHHTLALLATTNLLGSGVWAQTADTTDGNSASSNQSIIEEVVVTAQKREQSLNDVPISIAAATGEQLANAGVNSPSDLGKIAPGFTYQPSDYGTPVYTIRGIGFYDVAVAVAPAVSAYVDQVALPFLAMSQGAAFDVERVEVLKGPQGTLFGQNSTGGAINFIAAKPTEEIDFGGSVSYGRFNSVDTQGFVSGPLTETLTARVALRSERRDEWQKSVSRDDELGERDFSTARVILDWEATDSLHLQFNANGWVDKSDTVAAQYVLYSPVTPLAAGGFNDLEAAITANTPPGDDSRDADWDPGVDLARDDTFHQVSLRADYDISDSATLTSISAYSKLDQFAPNETDGVQQNNFRMTVDAEIESFSQELRLAGEAADQLQWMIGVNYSKDDTADDQTGDFNASNNGIRDPMDPTIVLARWNDFTNSSTQEIENKAVFGSLDYEINESLSVYGSARYNEETRDFDGCLRDTGNGDIVASSFIINVGARTVAGLDPFDFAPGVPGGCVTANDDPNSEAFLTIPSTIKKTLKEDNTSWRLGASWHPNEDSLIYANVTKGYKAGSFPTVPAIFGSQFDPVTQESVLAYETGFKVTLPEQAMQLNGAFFYYEYDDKQLIGFKDFPPFGNLPQLISIPESAVKGAELNVNWLPLEGLKFNVGVTYVDSKVKESIIIGDPFGAEVDAKGEEFPNTPSWQAVADTEYRFSLNDNLEAFIGANARYRSSSVAAFGEASTFVLPDYTLIDLRAGIATSDGHWTAQIWGRNVTDEFYRNNVSKVIDTVARTAGMPATYGISISYRY